MSKQYTTDVEGDFGGGGLGEEVSSSSLTSLNANQSPAGTVERHGRGSHAGGGAKQRLNSISSAASIASSQRGRPGGGYGGGGGEEEASPSPTASNSARRPQRVSTVGRSGLHKSTANTAATQETSEFSEKEKEELDRETRLEM